MKNAKVALWRISVREGLCPDAEKQACLQLAGVMTAAYRPADAIGGRVGKGPDDGIAR